MKNLRGDKASAGIFVGISAGIALMLALVSCSRPQARSTAAAPAVPQAQNVATTSTSTPNPEINQWCESLRTAIRKYRWPEDPCLVTRWRVGGHSVEGRPLVYAEFGSSSSTNTTLVFSMVHGNEVTPLFLGLRLAKWLQDNEEIFSKSRVIVAPLVNPDGFFKHPPTRMNANGVDVNRNFNTSDWKEEALTKWRNTYHSDPRRYPGEKPDSEKETQFQIEILRQFRPQKIISIHAPLNFLDYDGPNALTLARFPEDYVKSCQKLKSQVKAITGRFYPGSLGNYAGQERGIPTFTLELPTANPNAALGYWRRFKQGVRTVIEYEVSDELSKRWDQAGS